MRMIIIYCNHSKAISLMEKEIININIIREETKYEEL